MKSSLRLPEKHTMAEYTVIIYVAWAVLNTISEGFNGIPSIIVTVVTLIRALLYILLLVSLGMCVRYIKKWALIGYALLGIVLIINALSYTDVPQRFSAYMNSLIMLSLPMSLLGNYVEDNSVVDRLAKLGLIINIMYFVLLIGCLSSVFSVKGYDTSIGYSALIPEMALILSIKKSKIIKENIIRIISLIGYSGLVVLYGSRGPLLVLVIFAFYELIAPNMTRENAIKHLGRYLLAGVIIIVALFFRNQLIVAIGSVLQKFGFSSRTITLMVSNAGHLSGRDEIYALIWNEIKENPFKFRGIASDTLIVTGNQYTHNIILELLYEFGFIIGIIAIGIILYKIIYSFRSARCSSNSFMIILMFACIPQLMFSSTIWMNYVFWMWLFKERNEGTRVTYE